MWVHPLSRRPAQLVDNLPHLRLRSGTVRSIVGISNRTASADHTEIHTGGIADSFDKFDSG